MSSNPGEWLGLLKWSLAYTDGTGQSVAQEMSSDRRTWLEEAMSELIVDEAKRMKEIVEQLTELSTQAGAASEGEEDKVHVALFEELEDIVDNLDAAWDLIKMGSMDKLIEMLRSENPAFRVGASQIVSTCAQNNPKCQAALLQLGALAYTTHMSVHDQDRAVRLKALSAVSSLVRNCRDGERAFVDQGDGLLALVNGLSSTEHRFVAKCVHLLMFFLTDDASLRDADTLARHREIVKSAGVTQATAGLIGHDDVNVRLGCLGLLQKLEGVLESEIKQAVQVRLDQLCSETEEEKADNEDEIDMLQALLPSA